MTPRFAGLVLAAGRATRFGGAKLVQDFAGRPLALNPVLAAREAGLSPIVVTVGAEDDALAALFAREAPFAIVERLDDPKADMSASLRAGLARIAGVDGAVILLADMPLVDAGLIGAVIAAWRQGDVAVAPTYAGQRGHPVLLSAASFALAQTATGDRGLGPVLASGEGVRLVAVETRACLLDIDTRADLESARAHLPDG